MKEHNTDYLSDHALKWHPRMGIHSANVAPEFGVAETIALIEILETNNLHDICDEFLRISFESSKWVKWMVQDTDATDRDRSIIAGHYVFSSPETIELKKKASNILAKKDIDLEEHLKEMVKKSIYRYLYNFRLLAN